jgi:MoaA/NifB/PqqE/SkfB family radical SAM enzyme
VILKENVHEAVKIIRLAEKLGVDGIYFNKPVYTGVKFSQVCTYGLQVKDLSTVKLKVDVTYLNDVVPPCRAPQSCYITFDGKVLPCTIVAMTVPRSRYSLYTLGDLTKRSFKEIWFSSYYKELRSKMIDFAHGHLPFCAWCPHLMEA